MSNTAAALWASIVRTLVPVVVGAIVACAVRAGIQLDPEFEAALGAVLTAVFTAVYYIAVRLLETYVTPKLGWLLGFAKAPAVYSADGPDAAAAALVSAANGRRL